MRRPVLIVSSLALLALAVIVAAIWWYLAGVSPAELRLKPVAFAALPGWREANLAPALEAFRRSCQKLDALPPATEMGYAGTAADWQKACAAAQRTAGRNGQAVFESVFEPYAVGENAGLVTGYHEPLLNGSRRRHGAYQTPVYGLPGDLIVADLGAFKPEWKGEKLAGRLDGRRLVPYPARAEIDATPPAAPILLYADDPVAVFFLHIQGSGRVRLDDGSLLRLVYAGQNGRPYTPIGRTLVRQYGVPREGMSMQVIRAWLKAHPDKARGVMETDQSFVFFKTAPVDDPALGPPGSEGVALTPGASIAIDNRVHPFGVPGYIAGGGIAGLFVAQDTGGAIRGAARADIFFGFGPDAEARAGTLKAAARFFVLLPKSVRPRIAP